jgi:hypothetical protein
MTEVDPVKLAASVNRALGGEVSEGLRCVQFAGAGQRITLRFHFLGEPDQSDRESVGNVGAEVAADFPDVVVDEKVIPTRADDAIRCEPAWHTVFLRKETALAGPAFLRKETALAEPAGSAG